MRLSICKTVYPDGSFVEHENGMEVQIKKAPTTDEINKWFKEIHKNLNKSVGWKKHCR